MIKEFAYIIGDDVVNIAAFSENSEHLFPIFISDLGLDQIIPTNGNEKAMVGGKWDGIKFIPKQPFPSWTLDIEQNSWTPPTPYPKNGKSYKWVEEDLNWQLIESEI